MKIPIRTDKAPSPGKGPFSQGVICGNLIFTQGCVGFDLDYKLAEGGIRPQMHQVMKNLQAILEAGGATFADVVKTTIYLTDMNNYGAVNEIYAQYLPESYPAREAIQVSKLPVEGAMVEISMVADKPE